MADKKGPGGKTSGPSKGGGAAPPGQVGKKATPLTPNKTKK